MRTEHQKAVARKSAKAFRKRHPGHGAKRMQAYREANPEKAAETARRCAKNYYHEHKDDPGYKDGKKKVVRAWFDDRYVNGGWALYKAWHCKSRNLKLGLEPTDVTKAHLLKMLEDQGRKCFYTNIPFRMEEGIYSPSLDRRDPSQGYFLSNVVLCLAGINYAKHDSSQNKFHEFLQDIITHYRKPDEL